MHISQLRLLHFRIYRELAIDLLPGVNLVIGANGGGKTSLLEAIATVALTRSPRSGSIGELASWGELDMGVSATVVDRGSRADMEFRASVHGDAGRWVRRLRQDGQPVVPRQVLGRLGVVLFWPEDLLLVKGGPELRRRMLDVVLSQLDPEYAEQAVRYRRALEHRNAVLRGMRDGTPGRDELRPWTEAMVRHGAVLMRARETYLKESEPTVAEAAVGIGELGAMQLSYRPGLGGSLRGEADYEERLQAAIAASSQEELARAQSVVGPHRDDFEVILGGQPARQFASQGQQRSLVLAMKVAEVRRHLQASGRSPILLLDDVLSELDQTHRQGLISLLSQGLEVEQTLITATEEQGISATVPVAQVVEVVRGEIRTGRGA